jgi:CDGSH iron-sulfur domain-containing protein 3
MSNFDVHWFRQSATDFISGECSMPESPSGPPGAPLPITPVVAQRGPFEVELEAGKTYLWCACGRSQTQPFCDGSHSGSGLTPVRFEATSNGAVFLCGCKRTGDRPFCDGTHDTLD